MMIPKKKHQRANRAADRARTQVQDHYRALRAALNAGQGANAMIEIVHCYAVDGDVMACHCCDRRLHVSRWHEGFRHGMDEAGMDCPLLGTDNPWAMWFQATDMVRGTADTIAALRRAVGAAAERFREYQALHAAKPDPAKAQRNAEMAELCESALRAGG